jgi:hypothetical protein
MPKFSEKVKELFGLGFSEKNQGKYVDVIDTRGLMESYLLGLL